MRLTMLFLMMGTVLSSTVYAYDEGVEAFQANQFFTTYLQKFENEHGVIGRANLTYEGPWIAYATLSTRDNYDCKVTSRRSHLLFSCVNRDTSEPQTFMVN